MSVRAWFRRLTGAPLTPGDSERMEDGSTLTYLGKAPDPWEKRVCAICGGPATEYKSLPPWPGSTYVHTSMTCDDHRSYLDGQAWQKVSDGVWREIEATHSCGVCKGPYGECGHTAQYAAMAQRQQDEAVRGPVRTTIRQTRCACPYPHCEH